MPDSLGKSHTNLGTQNSLFVNSHFEKKKANSYRIPLFKFGLRSQNVEEQLFGFQSPTATLDCVLFLQFLRALWFALHERVSCLDELDMCTTRLRLQLPGEPDTDNIHVIHPLQVQIHLLLHLLVTRKL